MRKLRPLIAGALCAQVAVASAGASGRPSAFIDVGTFVPSLVVDMRYAGSHNFVGRPIKGYPAAECILTAPAAIALALAQKKMAGKKTLADRLGLLSAEAGRC